MYACGGPYSAVGFFFLLRSSRHQPLLSHVPFFFPGCGRLPRAYSCFGWTSVLHSCRAESIILNPSVATTLPTDSSEEPSSTNTVCNPEEIHTIHTQKLGLVLSGSATLVLSI